MVFFMFILLIIALVIIIIKNIQIENFYKNEKPPFNKQNYIKNDNIIINYIRKDFLTYNEKIFYKKLLFLEELGYKIFPQINLSTLIQKISNQKYQNELYRNIDFGVFDSDLKIILLIELNDQTHNSWQRKDRDLKVKKICEDANIPLLTFYTKYPNHDDYVKNRILNVIQNNQ